MHHPAIKKHWRLPSATIQLEVLKVPPGNMLEMLYCDRQGNMAFASTGSFKRASARRTLVRKMWKLLMTIRKQRMQNIDSVTCRQLPKEEFLSILQPKSVECPATL